MPVAVWALNGTGTTINLGAGGVYTYLFANYSGLGSEVWYVGNLSGIITLPAVSGLFRLANWNSPGPGVGAGVPDGGVTAMLRGLGLCSVGIFRRFAMS